jgi:hypothetical protein
MFRAKLYAETVVSANIYNINEIKLKLMTVHSVCFHLFSTEIIALPYSDEIIQNV